MRLISSRNSRFTRSYEYALPGLRSITPRASQRILMVTPKSHLHPDGKYDVQEERR